MTQHQRCHHLGQHIGTRSLQPAHRAVQASGTGFNLIPSAGAPFTSVFKNVRHRFDADVTSLYGFQ